jgi:hypothetical protein
LAKNQQPKAVYSREEDALLAFQLSLPLVELGALGLSAGVAYEPERNTSLESITRLTQLYDLERSFSMAPTSSLPAIMGSPILGAHTGSPLVVDHVHDHPAPRNQLRYLLRDQPCPRHHFARRQQRHSQFGEGGLKTQNLARHLPETP